MAPKKLLCVALGLGGLGGAAAFAPPSGSSGGARCGIVASSSPAEIESFMGATMAATDETKPKEDVGDYETLESGLKYKDLVVGTGASPGAGDELEVHYAGWYYAPGATEGVKFDDSKDRDANTGLVFELGIAPIIEGWKQGLDTMKQGGTRSIIVPPALGYGDKEVRAAGRPPIPPNSELRFELELKNVDNSIIRKARRAVGDFLRPQGIDYVSPDEKKKADAGNLEKPLFERLMNKDK